MALHLKLDEFIEHCHAKVLNQGSEIAFIETFSFDSRKVFEGHQSAFFALITQGNNGHKYVVDAYKKGVRVFVVSEEVHLPNDAWVLKVEETLAAAQVIAKHHRLKFKMPVLGITGSNGKTIVKEWLHQVMHDSYNIVRSPKSFNSQIGVPLSLSLLNKWNDLAIIETGISKYSEMKRIAEMVQPTHGLITNLLEAHSIGFENESQKLDEKLLLFQACSTIFYCKDQKEVAQKIESGYASKELVFWSIANTGFLSNVKSSKHGEETVIEATCRDKKISVVIPFIDAASIENAIHVWMVALYFGLKPEELVQRMAHLQSVEMRLNIVKGQQGSTIISDYYNSDPSSVRIALFALSQQHAVGKKIVILSAFEQIEQTESLYDLVFKMLQENKLDQIFLVGAEWQRFASKDGVKWFLTSEELLLELSQIQLRNAVLLIKGAREYSFEKIAEMLVVNRHQTFLEVSFEALVHNLNYYKSVVPKPVKIMAMVKAFSYGSGSVEVASVLQFHGVDYLGVAYMEEGVALRAAGISLPIMVMHPAEDALNKLIKNKLEPEIFSLRILRSFVQEIQKIQNPEAQFKIHLKIDTGMHRLGLLSSDLEEVVELLEKDKRIKVASVFSHLVGADSATLDSFSKYQVEQFDLACSFLENRLNDKFIKHVLNTAGALRFPNYSHDMVRLGIGLYGIDSSGLSQSQLMPVMRFVTHVSQFKFIEPGESVGYGRAFMAEKPMTIATLPVGYADGYFRNLGNLKSSVLINGHHCPVIGNVCMDMLMVDVTDIDVHEGDEVELFGNNISVVDVAKRANTIPYEILAHISSRVPRVYLQN